MSFPVLTSDKTVENYTYECAGYDVAYKDTYFDIYREKAFKQHLPKDISFVDELSDPVDWGSDVKKNKLLYLAGFNNGQMDGGDWGSKHRTADFQDKTIELIKENIKWTKIGAIASICSCVIQIASVGMQGLTYTAIQKQTSILRKNHSCLSQIANNSAEMRNMMKSNLIGQDTYSKIEKAQDHLNKHITNEIQDSVKDELNKIGDRLKEIQNQKNELKIDDKNEIIHSIEQNIDERNKALDITMDKIDNVHLKEPILKKKLTEPDISNIINEDVTNIIEPNISNIVEEKPIYDVDAPHFLDDFLDESVKEPIIDNKITQIKTLNIKPDVVEPLNRFKSEKIIPRRPIKIRKRMEY